jgi:protein TonB
MLAYAANRPRVGASQSSPNSLLFIACGHIALLAMATSVKMALPPKPLDPPIHVVDVPIHTPPPPVAVDTREAQHRSADTVQQPRPQLPTAVDSQVPLNPGPSMGPIASVDPGSVPLPPLPTFPPQPAGINRDAQLLTPSSDLRPPYPQTKLLAGEEASLNLRLTIDESGRVVAVDPVGRADPVFLSAARRHLLSHWRYKPAMKDGHAVPTSIVISLRFELDA